MSEQLNPEFDRSDLAKEIAAQTGMFPDTVIDVIKSFAAILPYALAEHGRVEIHGLGTFSIAHREARSGTTPDGTPWATPERQEIVFHAAPSVNHVVTEKTGKEMYSA